MDFFQIFFEKEKEKPSSLTQKNTKKKGEVNHLKDSLDSGKQTVAMGNPPF